MFFVWFFVKSIVGWVFRILYTHYVFFVVNRNKNTKIFLFVK